MTKQGRILIVSGPSGVGKSTVCEQLLAQEGFELSVSATTRAPRGGEVEGQDYFFLDREEFRARIDRAEFLEWAEVHGHTLYGTPAAPVLEHLAAGRHVLLDIDVQGAQQLRAKGLPVTSVFLEPPSREELRRRLEGRDDTSPEEIAIRLETAEKELAQAWRYDLRVVNDELPRTVARIQEFLDQA